MNNPTPTAHHWTLRFKHERSTVFLAALPVTPFTTIKSDLLSALTSAGKTSLSGCSLEKVSLEDIELGLPQDKWDLQKGWVPLVVDGGNIEDGEDDGNEDPEKKSTGRRKEEKVMNATPQGAGLKDGAIIAFRFRGNGNAWPVEIPSYEEEQPTEMDED